MKFLGRARRFFQDMAPAPEAKVQYFNVICASGHRVRGERTEGYQALRCPACGEGVFVLPRSPLPEPVAPPRPSARKAAELGDRWVEEGPVELTDPARVSVEAGDRESGRGDAEIIWDDEPVETAPPVVRTQLRERPGADDVQIAGPPDAAALEAARRAAAARGRGSPQPRQRKPARDSEPAPGGATIPTNESRPPRTRVRHAGATRRGQPEGEPEPDVPESTTGAGKRARHRWLLVVVPLLVIATVAWRYRRHSMQEYPLIAEKGRTEGILALDEGNFDKAYQLLSAAKVAVDALGGAVDDAEAIRVAADEAAIFNNLLPETLEELLADAGRTDPPTWKTKFDTFYKGKAILVDSWITAEPDPPGTGGYDIMYKVFPPGAASNFREGGNTLPDRTGMIDFTGFQLFELVPQHVENRVTFGARLAGFEYDGDREKWMIRLEPKSGVFITHTKALETIGWQSGAETPQPAEGER